MQLFHCALGRQVRLIPLGDQERIRSKISPNKLGQLKIVSSFLSPSNQNIITGTSSSYYTLMVWFPELFNRYEEFEHKFPNTSASVCDVSGIVVADEASADPFDCLKTIDGSVYMHTLIVGLACIPTSLWLPLCVHKLGAKFFLSK